MDWQIRIALIIAGVLIIGYIVYDFNRRKKDQLKKQRLIDQMRSSAEHVDNLGFDYTGVGNVRKAPNSDNVSYTENRVNEDSFNDEKQPIETSNYVDESNANLSSENDQSAEEKSINTQNDFEVDTGFSYQQKSIKTKQAPTEQLDLVDLNKEPDFVFSLILKAKEDKTYKGSEFLPILLSQGLRHGDMDIFHRHVSNPGKKPVVLYSVANAINPGTFDIKNIQNFETPAFAFFMTVPGPTDPMMAYEGMVKTIKLLKQELGGSILDESKSIFTEQTYQHHRDRLQDYLIKSSIKQSKR